MFYWSGTTKKKTPDHISDALALAARIVNPRAMVNPN